MRQLSLWTSAGAAIAISAAAIMGAAAPAAAQEAAGTWLRQSGTSQIRISPCGQALCGKIVWLREPNDENGRPRKDAENPNPAMRNRPLMGTQVILNMRPAGDGKWEGQVYKADEGKTYTGSMQMRGADKLKLSGCVLGGLICKSETMSRVR